jgi:hypothetical protein
MLNDINDFVIEIKSAEIFDILFKFFLFSSKDHD